MKKYRVDKPQQLDAVLARLKECGLGICRVHPNRTFSVDIYFDWDWPSKAISDVVLFKPACDYEGFGVAQRQEEQVPGLSELKPSLERLWMSGIEPNVILKMTVKLSGNDPWTWEVRTEYIRGELTITCLMPHASEPGFDRQHLQWINQIRYFANGEPFDTTMTVDRSSEYFKIMRGGENIRRVPKSDNQACFEVYYKKVQDQATWVPEYVSNLVKCIAGIDGEARDFKIGVEWSVGFQRETRLKGTSGVDLNKFLSTVRSRVMLPSIELHFVRWTNDAEEVFEYQSWLKGKGNLWEYDSIFCQPQGELVDPSGKTISVKAKFYLKLEADGVYLIVDSKQDISWILVDEVGLELVKTKKSKKK